MNSDLNNDVPSDDLRHENNYEAYATAEDVNAFYDENENNYNQDNEDEVEDEVARRIDEDKKSYVSEVRRLSKGSLLDFVYVGKEREEEEETPHDFVDDSFSPVKYDDARFDYATLSYEERQEIVQKLRDLFSEANVLMVVNKFLHKNYIDINRKSPSMANALDKFDETLIFEDTRYLTTLENFAQTRDDVDGRETSLIANLENMESSFDSARSTYVETFETLLSHQLSVAKKTKPPKYDKESWLLKVERFLINQRRRALGISKIRLVQMRLHGKLEKLMGRLKKFDSLGPGFSMMDYEYLLKRKEVYSERRDEQRENIKKLNKKNLSSAAIIRHIDEEADLYNEKVINNLDNLQLLVNKNKNERSEAVELAKTKVSISKSMTRLKEEIGLLNYPFLLKKMERDLRELAKTKKRIDTIQAKMLSDAKKLSKSR